MRTPWVPDFFPGQRNQSEEVAFAAARVAVLKLQRNSAYLSGVTLIWWVIWLFLLRKERH
jgi:hypothetical protein